MEVFMKSQKLRALFLEELEDMYNSEKRIVVSLPKLIQLASFPELKKGLEKHLRETETQILRIEEIFELLRVAPMEKSCQAMGGILKEADMLVEDRTKTATLDAAIISAAQKVEHYEIASYGTLCSFAKYLNLDERIIHLLKATLDEEKGADKALNKIAEGTLFTRGINKEAALDDETVNY
jgi:ferritin-like metal-binding protein YciE